MSDEGYRENKTAIATLLDRRVIMAQAEEFTWYEFFSGGGMARLGLGEKWKCTFANEWCAKKAAAYRSYFGNCDELRQCDVAKVTTQDLPGRPTLVWASFPCQDLSLAGMGAGLKGKRSGTFAPFWSLMQELVSEGRSPKIIALENVTGAITSRKGQDIERILRCLVEAGYRPGALVMDAVHFLPQSRPRLFIIAVRKDLSLRPELWQKWPDLTWHSRSLMKAYAMLASEIRTQWIWWSLPQPAKTISKLSSIIEAEQQGVPWHSSAQTAHLLAMMSDVHRAKLHQAQATGVWTVGTVYRRTRPDGQGRKTQRAEVRFDEISGCLRTPVGGSSRQTVLIVRGRDIKSRLLTPREAARLMGVPEDYPIPANYNDAYHLFGDGVVVPVVGWLEKHIFRPIAELNSTSSSARVA